MNELNYASLEASKRLADSGIVLETDYVWYLQPDGDWRLAPKHDVGHLWRVLSMDMLPAPCMAEVWRELPDSFIEKRTDHYYCSIALLSAPIFPDENPTDALIDLLIWQRKEANHDRG